MICLIYSCGNIKNANSKKNDVFHTEFTYQEFDLETFKGKWLTNSKYDKNNFAVFQENFYVLYDDNRYVPYILKKDSIFIFFNKLTAKGRLINLNDKEVEILWGNLERIKYYRP
jgi:hypothetical protein